MFELLICDDRIIRETVNKFVLYILTTSAHVSYFMPNSVCQISRLTGRQIYSLVLNCSLSNGLDRETHKFAFYRYKATNGMRSFRRKSRYLATVCFSSKILSKILPSRMPTIHLFFGLLQYEPLSPVRTVISPILTILQHNVTIKCKSIPSSDNMILVTRLLF